MKLFDYYRSSASYRVRIALQYKQITCDYEHVHLLENGGEHHSDSFCSKNPQQLLPVLEHKGRQLNQSLAILEYLEQEFPQQALLPSNHLLSSQVKAFALEVACEIHPLNNLRVLKYLDNKINVDQQTKMDWYFHWLDTGFSSLQQKLQTGPFCFGASPTWADLFLIPQIYNAKRFSFDMQKYTELEAIYNHCLQQEYFIKASPEERLKNL